MVAEEADGLEDDSSVAFVADGFERVLDGRADPGAAGDALALEGEEPGLQFGKLAGGGGEDQFGGTLRLNRIRVRRGLLRGFGTGSGDARFSGHNRPARD